MQKIKLYIPLFLLSLLIFSCNTTYQPKTVQYKDYKINNTGVANTAITALLKPYADSVNKSMNDVIAICNTDLEKKQPEGTLGNVLADAMLKMGEKKFNTRVDAAFINYGGIRLPGVSAGNITRGKIFEMSPFDNLIILQSLSGKVLQQFADFVAEKGGWPCSGISFTIKNKKAVNIMIGGKPLDENATYTIANNDYVVNGGDDCEVLKKIPQQNKAYIFRDAIFDYFSALTKEGKQVNGKIENRITNAE